MLALLLGAGTVAVMVFLAFSVSGERLRLAFFAVACLLGAAVVLVLPPQWRKRLGPPTAVFVAAASALSVFLVSPEQTGSPNSSDPKVDTQEMANAILVGPFDQRLPSGITARDPVAWGTRDASAVSNLAVVKVEMVPTTSTGATTGRSEATTQIEVYPTPEMASARADVQYRWLSGEEEAIRKGKPAPNVGKNTREMWCFVWDNRWRCGGHRGHAYVETFMKPGDTTQIAYTSIQMMQSAALAYAENKEKLATEPR